MQRGEFRSAHAVRLWDERGQTDPREGHLQLLTSETSLALSSSDAPPKNHGTSDLMRATAAATHKSFIFVESCIKILPAQQFFMMDTTLDTSGHLNVLALQRRDTVSVRVCIFVCTYVWHLPRLSDCNRNHLIVKLKRHIKTYDSAVSSLIVKLERRIKTSESWDLLPKPMLDYETDILVRNLNNLIVKLKRHNIRQLLEVEGGRALPYHAYHATIMEITVKIYRRSMQLAPGMT